MVQKLGHAFGIVILVTHKQEKKKYVAKKMKFEPTPADLDKCLKEVELLRSMQHPNIVPYKEYFVHQEQGLLILIMENCECKFPVLIIF